MRSVPKPLRSFTIAQAKAVLLKSISRLFTRDVLDDARGSTRGSTLGGTLGNSGATALEFGLVAFPFIILVLAIFEIGIVFFEQATLSEAVTDVGRQIRTGQALNSYGTQTASQQAASIVTQICTVALMPSCNSLLTIKVDNPASFAAYSAASPLQGTAPNQTLSPSAVTLGTACTIQIVHAYYPWKILVPMNRWWLGTAGMSGTYLLSAALVFENEPFSTTICSPNP